MDNYIYENYVVQGSILSRDFFNMIVGEEIGHGISRHVYNHDLDKSLVIKFEPPIDTFENRIEWEIWKLVKDLPSVARWFAPCHYISPCGTALVQSKCTAAPESKYPDRVPKCFTDMKYQNWGLYKGRVVCFDYGAKSTIILSEGLANCSKLKKAKWWDQ